MNRKELRKPRQSLVSGHVIQLFFEGKKRKKCKVPGWVCSFLYSFTEYVFLFVESRGTETEMMKKERLQVYS